MKSAVAVLVSGLFIADWILAQPPEPVGGQFQVNSYTTSYQALPDVAADSQGNFVVVWHSYGSYGTDSSFYSIQVHLYDASGVPVGGQFQANSYTLNNQIRPVVGTDLMGNFVVVWESNGSFGTDTFLSSIQGQRYDASGTPLSDQFQVNSYTTNRQRRPAVAMDPQGDFVVVWDSQGSYGSDNDSSSIQAKRYESDGTSVGGEFQVNSYTTSYQAVPAVARDAQGSFVVTWLSVGSLGTDTSLQSIQAQRFDASGIPLGGQFQVNTYTTDFQIEPAVAADAQGKFVAVWQSNGSSGSDTSANSIQAQRFEANGAPVGGQFQVNAYTTSVQDLPKVAADVHGNFMVVWRSFGSFGTDTSIQSIQAQMFDFNATPLGDQFQVNSYTTSYQYRSAVASDPQGGFVVVWESHGSYGSDTDAYSIQGQRYSSGVILTDGFESGDTSAWSSTQ